MLEGQSKMARLSQFHRLCVAHRERSQSSLKRWFSMVFRLVCMQMADFQPVHTSYQNIPAGSAFTYYKQIIKIAQLIPRGTQVFLLI